MLNTESYRWCIRNNKEDIGSLSDYGGEENMMEMNVPINYCPRCGKKL